MEALAGTYDGYTGVEQMRAIHHALKIYRSKEYVCGRCQEVMFLANASSVCPSCESKDSLLEVIAF